MTALPPEIAYGFVTDRIVLGIGDGPDPDRLPDPRPAEGTVRFTPKRKVIKVNLPEPGRVLPQAVEGRLDADGRLVDDQGAPGVWLVEGTWTVTYNFKSVSVDPHDILVTPEHTEENPLYLSHYMPPGGPVLSATQYAELHARIDGLEVGGGAPAEHTHSWAEVTGAPDFMETSTFAAWTDVVQQGMNLKSDKTHTHDVDVLDVNGLEAELQDKADAQTVYDTGWVLVPLEDGWTGTARVRRTGSLVHFNVTDLVGPATSSLSTLAVVPEGFRAGPGFTAHGLGATSSNTAVGAVAMTATSSGGGPDMSQNVRVSTPSSWSGGAGNIWWHTDEPMPSSQDLAAMRGDGARGGPITHAEIVARSARWFPPAEPEQVPYSRQDTYPDGDGHEYRRDCSGFVSMCLHADRSYSTRSIEEISTPITKDDLVPGDYLNSPDNHVVLFLGWVDETQTRYYARESSGPKGGTIERDVPYPYYSAVETYTPLRYVNVTD